MRTKNELKTAFNKYISTYTKTYRKELKASGVHDMVVASIEEDTKTDDDLYNIVQVLKYYNLALMSEITELRKNVEAV